MKIRPTTIADIKRMQIRIQKRRAKERLEAYIRSVATEIYPRDLFMRDRNVSSNTNESIISTIQGYMGKLDSSNDVFAPWGKLK